MKTISILTAAVASISLLFGCETDERRISYDALPSAAKTFITTHFGSLTVVSVTKDADLFETAYEVCLSDGTNIDFNGSGEWHDVDCATRRVPDAIIPAKTLEYVTAAYPAQFIVKIGKSDLGGYDVELDNSLDLDFASDGSFLRIDD